MRSVGPDINPFSLAPGSKVLQNDEFTKDLFRFLQLLCEGHNNGRWFLCVCGLHVGHGQPPPGRSGGRGSPCRLSHTGSIPIPTSVFVFFVCFRFPELPENSDGEHHHRQYYHQHRGLPAQTPGKEKRCVD